MMTPLLNTVIRACRALNNLNGYGSGPAGNLINVLFGDSKPSSISQPSKLHLTEQLVYRLSTSWQFSNFAIGHGTFKNIIDYMYSVLSCQIKLNSLTRTWMIPRRKPCPSLCLRENWLWFTDHQAQGKPPQWWRSSCRLSSKAKRCEIRFKKYIRVFLNAFHHWD